MQQLLVNSEQFLINGPIDGDPYDTPLCRAAQSGDTLCFNLLIEKGARITFEVFTVVGQEVSF